MGRINVLGFDVANLIAAGEVVDRPASVVKELLENAIDAGSRKITVEIQRGGSAFIRVSDDGCGIARDDLPVAILRHATSKIKTASDLDSIGTLGFRGEALAATAAVSRLRILSKTADASFGAMLETAGGEDVTLADTGCADGTTIIVEDLFFNVPARRKFLKKDSTETVAVTGVVEKIALSVPHVAVKYITDGELKFATPGDGSLKGVIYALYGRDVAKRITEVDRTDGGVRVSGFISEADFIRSNRNMENFFINGRYVRSRTIMAAVEQAYVSKMQADKFPFCVLNLEINPAAVDVNVHPSKLEVKFSNERIIFDAVYYTVLSALEGSASRPELSFTGKVVADVKPELGRPVDGIAGGTNGGRGTDRHSAADVFRREADQIRRSFVPLDGRGEYATRPKDQLGLADRADHNPPKRSDGADGAGSISEANRGFSADVSGKPSNPGESLAADAGDWVMPPSSETGNRGEELPSRRFVAEVTPADEMKTPAKPTGAWADPGAEQSATSVGHLDDSVRKAGAPASPCAASSAPSGGTMPSRGPASTDANRAGNGASASPGAAYSAPGDGTMPSREPASTDANRAGNGASASPCAASLPPTDKAPGTPAVPHYLILGEAYNCYILVQLDDRLLVVDKHAAHERILFDQMCRNMRSREKHSQMLLFPIEVMLTEPEREAVRDYSEQIFSLGFGFRLTGDKCLMNAVPEELSREQAEDMLVTMAGRLAEGGGNFDSAGAEFFERTLWQAACKAAIKGGRVYGQEHLKWICDRILSVPDEGGSVIKTCPHGRPVAFEIKKSSIERQFARIQ